MGDIRQPEPAVQTRGSPPAGTMVIVDVFAEENGGNVTFTHDWRFDGGSSQGNGAIVIPQKDSGQPGTPIQFHLRGGQELGLQFVRDPQQVIWLNRDDCPSEQGGDAEIPEDRIRSTPRLLTIQDLNEDECSIHYRLRFEPDPNQYFYDPEIRNGGKTVF